MKLQIESLGKLLRGGWTNQINYFKAPLMGTWKLKSRQIYLHVWPWCSCTKPVYYVFWARRQHIECSVDWTCILEAPCSRDAVTHYLQLCLANLKFQSSAMPVNSQLVGHLPVVILDLLEFHLDFCFSFVLSPIITNIAINSTKGK